MLLLLGSVFVFCWRRARCRPVAKRVSPVAPDPFADRDLQVSTKFDNVVKSIHDLIPVLKGEGDSGSPATGKFCVSPKELVFGQPTDAAHGLENLLCMDADELRSRMNGGIKEMRREVMQNGTLTDQECLCYVLDMEAGSSGLRFQDRLKRDCGPDGMLLKSRMVEGSARGKWPADFVKGPEAVASKLKAVHVAALRFYTTAAFGTINNPLRDEARLNDNKPHPLPVTVAFIREAISRLRAVEGELEKRLAYSGDGGGGGLELTLYRGMSSAKVPKEFMKDGVGGTERAPMSTTSDLEIALRYSLPEDGASASSFVIMRVITKTFMDRGPNIAFLSAFPNEAEYLFPPLTYLKPTGGKSEKTFGGIMWTVLDVEARL